MLTTDHRRLDKVKFVAALLKEKTDKFKSFDISQPAKNNYLCA